MLDRAPGPGGAWQHRWSSLRLGTAHRVNDLPGMAELGVSFDTADRALPAKEVVADYYGRFEEHFDLRVRRPMNVRSVVNEGIDLLVRYEDLSPQPIEEEEPAKGFFGRRRTDLPGAAAADRPATRDRDAVPRERDRHVGLPVRAVLPRHGRLRRPAPAHLRLRRRRRTSATSTSWWSAAAPRRSASCSSSRRSRPGSPGCPDARSTGSTARSSTSRARPPPSRCRTRPPAPVAHCRRSSAAPACRRAAASRPASIAGSSSRVPCSTASRPTASCWDGDEGGMARADVDHLGDRVPSRPAPPRAAAAAREGGRHHRRPGRVVERPAHLPRRLRAAGLDDRREPRRPHDRPPDHGDALASGCRGIRRPPVSRRPTPPSRARRPNVPALTVSYDVRTSSSSTSTSTFVEVLEVEASDARGVRADALEQVGVRADAVGEVHGRGGLAR